MIEDLIELYIVDETNQPEGEDKKKEKERIDHPHEELAETNLAVTLTLGPCLGLGERSLSESVYVGLHQDVHEGLEEAEDQPAVDHLDVGGLREIGVHTKTRNLSLSLSIKIFS